MFILFVTSTENLKSVVFQALFMPYDHKNVTPDGLISRLMRSLLDDLNYHHCQNRCLVGSGGGLVGFVPLKLMSPMQD